MNNTMKLLVYTVLEDEKERFIKYNNIIMDEIERDKLSPTELEAATSFVRMYCACRAMYRES